VPTLGEFVNFSDILTEELNVKQVLKGDALVLDLTITPQLKREGLSREIIRYIQSARKAAGLNVDDRIVLSLVTDDAELKVVVDEYADVVKSETLATGLSDATYSYELIVKIDDAQLKVSLQKA
jgi:isoleucyl-tRNA synthetase